MSKLSFIEQPYDVALQALDENFYWQQGYHYIAMAEQNHRLSSILSCFGLSVSKPINFRFCAVSCYHLSLLNLDRLLGFLEYCQAFEAHLQFVQLDLGNVSGKVASG